MRATTAALTFAGASVFHLNIRARSLDESPPIFAAIWGFYTKKSSEEALPTPQWADSGRVGLIGVQPGKHPLERKGLDPGRFAQALFLD